MKLTRSLPTQPHRDAWVEVNLAALEANVTALRAFVPKSQKLMAIVKADAYGHGAVMTLPTLMASGIDMLGVASIDEGVQIREAGFNLPILVIGPSPSWAYTEALDHGIQLTVFEPEHIRQLNVLAQQRNTKAVVQVKVDTGMHRIGAKPDQMSALWEMIEQSSQVQLMGVFSHLACSDDEAYTRQQHDVFQAVLKAMPKPLRQQCEWIHISNSTGMVYPFIRGEALETSDNVKYTGVRLGISLWGYWDSPTEAMRQQLPTVYPVMSLRGRIVHLHDIPQNEGVSYTHSDRSGNPLVSPPGVGDGKCVASDEVLSSLSCGQDTGVVYGLDSNSLSYSGQSDGGVYSGLLSSASDEALSSQVNQNSVMNNNFRRIATCPIGYADGIPRLLSNHMFATLKQTDGPHKGVWMSVPQVGNITMDQLMFDVSNCPNVSVGDTLTLFGYTAEHQHGGSHAVAVAPTAAVTTLTDWARTVQSIEYELMCSLRVRLPRAYTRHTAFMSL